MAPAVTGDYPRAMRTFLLAAAVFGASLVACTPATVTTGTSGDGGTGAAAALTSLELQPADATVVVEDGLASPLDFSALGRYADGHGAAPGDAQFSLDAAAAALGSLAGGRFTPSGLAAGTGQVTVTAGGRSASTSLTVVVRQSHLGAGVPSTGPAQFQDPLVTGAQSPTIAYPLEGAVMPSSVAAPDVQWLEGGAAGDLYRVRLTAGGASVQALLVVDATFAFHWPVPERDWRLLVASAHGAPVVITVDHWDAASGAQASAPVKVRVIDANVGGAVYYWDLTEGRLQRLDQNGQSRAIANPPEKPGAPGNRCIACHTVSRDGRYLSAELWAGNDQGAVFDLSDPAVITGNPAPSLAPLGSYVALFSTFNPDASRLLINKDASLRLINPQTGAAVATQGTPLPASGAAHPVWSPDGTQVAYIGNIDGAWAVDYTSGDVQVLPVTGPDTFGPPQPLVASSSGDPAFKAPSWPTYSPDSQWVAYGAGTNSRGRYTAPNAATITYPGALFMVSRAGGAPRPLTQACGGARDCYLPNFSPYDSGGFFWLAFYSLRDYGNGKAGTRGSSRRQLWVTAIDHALLAGGGDPSAVPYWLPGQDAHTDNMSAFWAVPPPLR